MTTEEKQRLDLRYTLIKILAGIGDDYAGTLDKLEELIKDEREQAVIDEEKRNQ